MRVLAKIKFETKRIIESRKKRSPEGGEWTTAKETGVVAVEQ